VTSNDEPRTTVILKIVLRDRPEPMGLNDLVSRLYHLDLLFDLMAWEPGMYEQMIKKDTDEVNAAVQDRKNPQLRSFYSTVRSVSYNSPVNIAIELTYLTAGLMAAVRAGLTLHIKYIEDRERLAARPANIAESGLRTLKAEAAIEDFKAERVENTRDSPLTPDETVLFARNTEGLVELAAAALEDIEEASIIEESQSEESPEGL
jgi:hypothetical protein